MIHDEEGDLQFLDDVHDVDYSVSQLLCLHDAVQLGQGLVDAVRQLPEGHTAERDTATSAWRIGPLPPA